MNPGPRLAWAGWCFVAQAIATVAWWMWMGSSPDARAVFFAHHTDSDVLLRFAVPDLLVFGSSSLVAGVLALRGLQGALCAGWIALGSAAYATVGELAVNWPIGQLLIADAARPSEPGTDLSSPSTFACPLTRMIHVMDCALPDAYRR